MRSAFAYIFLLLPFLYGCLAKEELILDLHSRACIGLPFDSIHLQSVCVVETRNRATCEEIHRFFRTLNETYKPTTFSDLNPLIKKRLKQEPAIQHASAGDTLCVNVELPQVVSHCPTNFIEFDNKCYVATPRRVSYERAQEECAMIRGSLVEENTPGVVELLNYLVEFYIHSSVFTGYGEILNNKYQKPANFNVEADYYSGELQYLPPTSTRGFVCVVPTGVFTVPLYQSVAIPSTADLVLIHDIDAPSLPNIPNFNTYLADLFEFKQYVDEKLSHTLYRIDLLESPPADSTYIRSLGSLVLPVKSGNITTLPNRISEVCDKLSLLYRGHDNEANEEVLTLYPILFVENENIQFNSIGYCAAENGHCGTSIPIYKKPSQDNRFARPICYGFDVKRDLDSELELHKPFRYAQLAKRIEPIYMTYYADHFNTHYHRVPNSGGQNSSKVFQLINPLYIEQLSYFCSEKLVKMYRVVDYVNDNSILVVNETELNLYRSHRDQYEEEELLGYCSSEINYCGSSLPINHYIVYHEYSNHIDDVYLPYKYSNSSLLPRDNADRPNFENVLCFGF